MTALGGLGEWDAEAVVDRDADEQPGVDDDPDRGSEAPALYFDSLDEFVREMIVPVFRRRVGDRSEFHWDAEWWRHPEAVIRLDALWRSWEHLRLDPATGISIWLRDHADHHLPILFSDYGPFAKSSDVSEHGEPLPYAEPPAGLYPPHRTQR